MKKTITRTILVGGRYTCLALLIYCAFFQASYASARTPVEQGMYDVKISLQVQNATLADVINKIENLTDYTFAFNKELVASKHTALTLNYSGESVGHILDQIGAKLQLKFKQINHTISIQELELQQASTQPPVVITGKITDEVTGEALIGVNVFLQGTTTGTVTNVEGTYRVEVPDADAVLVFSYIGYVTKEVPVGNRTVIDVMLQADTQELSEVVVTAFGVEREKRSLGYAVQDVEGADLVEAREGNMTSSLAGRVAGVSVMSNASVGASTRVVIRGESSLDINKNQPLFVVDGIPISNDIYNTSNVDYGNPAGEINPDDIKSISVLKGPSASALYGSRASNGVIIITTKSGKSNKGIGISVNAGMTFQTPLVLPKFQNKFGQGDSGQFEGSNFGYDGIYANDPTGGDSYDESWGPRLDVGDERTQFDSPTENGYRGGDVHILNRGDIIATPWVSHPNNIRNFFELGKVRNLNVALSGGGERSNYRLSFTNLDQQGMVPNNDLQRNTIALKTNFWLTDKLSASASVNYMKTESSNRPVQGYSTNTPMYFFTWMGRQVNMNSLKDYWQPGLEGVQQFNFNYNYHNNPYFLQYENTNSQIKDRILGFVSLTYDFTPNLSLKMRTGTDLYNDLRPYRKAFSTQGTTSGSYSEIKVYFEERNSDFLLSYHKALNNDWGVGASFGGNQMIQTRKQAVTTAPQLLIPGIYNFGNTAADLTVTQTNQSKRINSLYATGQLNYREMIYLDITGRNDWSSTLPKSNRSYFYPSVSMSGVLSDMFTLPAAISFAKLRVGWAEVGNDTDPYSLRNTYSYSQSWDGYAAVTTPSKLKNSNLKPESISTYEIGTNLQFFKNRLNLDVTYYDAHSRDQILPLEVSETSGYATRVINAGEIRNQGVEVMLGGTPLKLSNGFRWDISVNFSRNRGKVVKLVDGISSYNQSSPGEDSYIQARVGERMGAIYGPGFERAPDGQIIIGTDGNPETTSDLIYLGNYNPDWMAGVSNTFSFKGITLSALFDIRQGGVFISRFLNKAMGAGQLKETQRLREDREVGTEYDAADYYHEGVNLNTDGTYTANQYGVTIRDYYKQYYDHNSEAQTLDASFVKLRELKLGYTVPAKVFGGRLPFQAMSISIVGRNLALWTKNQHFDPETVATGSTGMIPGYENMSIPTAKSWGFNINFKL